MERTCKTCAHQSVCIFYSVNWHGKDKCESWMPFNKNLGGRDDEKHTAKK